MSLIKDASIPPTLGYEHEKETDTRKRKRCEIEKGIELDRRPFTIRPDSTDPFGAPRTFTPICMLSRAQLPLSYLDTYQQGRRIFSAHITTLEACHEREVDSSVLVAEEAKEKRLYAIERAQRRTYALCRLGPWVKRGELEKVSALPLRHGEQQVKRKAIQPVEDGQPWWSRAAVPLPVDLLAEDEDNERMPELAMKPVNAPIYTDLTTKGTTAASTAATTDVSTPADQDATDVALAAPVTAQDVLQDLAKHYLEALYLSRTSLAYFTKGPLSRARAAIDSTTETGRLHASELVAFLREAVLTASVMDKKYRDGVTGIVNELPAPGLETPEQPTKAKKKRKWKSKRDKAGFYADEKEYVEKWWRLYDEASDVPGSAETMETRAKRRIPRIRSRETYIQIILALEVLALEASIASHPEKPAEQSGAAEPQNPVTQDQDSQAPIEAKKSKPKKPQDLPALLETLVDRLCIWHSLESSSPTKPDNTNGTDHPESSNDELKSFCFEVIIPFYMSRAPQHAANVNKKLGGPSAPTPVKRKSASSRKPGEPAIRQAPERKPRKPLGRVASDALNHVSRRLPSLHRSATDTDALLSHIKRENSETPAPLGSIPQADAKVPQPRKRTSLMHSISFTNGKREVDLSAMSQANEAKMRKKMEVDEKLREAISTLKKPNRALANKEVAENADLSFAKATARSRAGAGAQRTKTSVVAAEAAVMGQGVHVTATPKHGRVRATPGRHLDHAASVQRDGSGATSYVPSSSARPLPQAYEPPSSTFLVPQTGHRPRHGAPATGVITAGTGVEETPSRGFARFMPAGLARLPGTLESPSAARHEMLREDFGVVDSPTASRRGAPPAIGQTPIKPIRSLSLAAQSALVAASPNVLRPPDMREREKQADEEVGKGRTKSVYDALGWEEDEYEELA